jgi:O-antigen/teichoic acid export membrane protein
VARNTLFSAVGEGSNLLIFALGFLLARGLGPSEFGLFATASAFVGLFRILPDFGMSYASTLEIARERSLAGRLVGNLLGFQAALSLLTLGVCLSMGAWLYTGALRLAVAVLCFDLVMKAVKSTLRWLLKGFELFAAESVSLLVERGALLALGAFSLHAGWGLAGIVLVFAGVRALDTSALAAWVHARVLPLRPAADLGLWRELFVKGLPFAYAGAMVTAFFQVDQVMLQHLRGATETGWYKAPVLVLEGLALVPRVFSFAFIPTMAALYATAPETVTALYRRGLKYLLLLGLPIAAFGALAAAPFLGLLFTSDYAPSAAAGLWLIPACVFMFLSNFVETTLACIQRWRVIVATSTVALALNVGLNLAWIPRWGYVGAAWATLATEGFYFVSGALVLHRAGLRASWPSLAWRPLTAAAAFAAVLAVTLPYGLFPAAGAASLAWVATTFALGVWDAQEREALRHLLRRG